MKKKTLKSRFEHPCPNCGNPVLVLFIVHRARSRSVDGTKWNCKSCGECIEVAFKSKMLYFVLLVFSFLIGGIGLKLGFPDYIAVISVFTGILISEPIARKYLELRICMEE